MAQNETEKQYGLVSIWLTLLEYEEIDSPLILIKFEE
jgi:hypothetical protein